MAAVERCILAFILFPERLPHQHIVFLYILQNICYELLVFSF